MLGGAAGRRAGRPCHIRYNRTDVPLQVGRRRPRQPLAALLGPRPALHWGGALIGTHPGPTRPQPVHRPHTDPGPVSTNPAARRYMLGLHRARYHNILCFQGLTGPSLGRTLRRSNGPPGGPARRRNEPQEGTVESAKDRIGIGSGPGASQLSSGQRRTHRSGLKSGDPRLRRRLRPHRPLVRLRQPRNHVSAPAATNRPPPPATTNVKIHRASQPQQI
jgi:hypothetical protein